MDAWFSIFRSSHFCLADSKEEYEAWLADKTQKLGIQHTTRYFIILSSISLSFFLFWFFQFSPICFLGTEDDGEYLGGADEFIAYLSERFSSDIKRDSNCVLM